MKSIFNRMAKAGMIEKVPGNRTASTAWRKKKSNVELSDELRKTVQQPLFKNKDTELHDK